MPSQPALNQSLLDDVLAATRTASAPVEQRLERFLRTGSGALAEALIVWMDLRPGDPVPSKREVQQRLVLDMAALDKRLEAQLNQILHAKELQRLEASWRGLSYVVGLASDADNVIVRVFSATWRSLARDLDKAIEFDQSVLFRKVYNDEFGTPGGQPYGVLLGDYYVSHKPREDQPVDDVRALRAIAQVAAASFAPFVASAHPVLFGLDAFEGIGRNIDLERAFALPEYTAWNSMRDAEDSRFVALTLPRVLMRKPWRPDSGRADPFPFVEDVTSSPSGESNLWGNACYALGGVLIRAFDRCGWFGDIRGVQEGEDGGGLVTDLPTLRHDDQARGAGPQPSTDVIVTDQQERTLSDLGLISLCACQGTTFHAFYATPTLQRPVRTADRAANANARLSAMLQYMMCTSRISHYLKVMCRDRSGSYTSAGEIESEIGKWLFDLSVSSEDSDAETRAKYPLGDCGITVREVPGKPGTYSSVIHLRPHFQLDQMSSSIRLTTEILNTR